MNVLRTAAVTMRMGVAAGFCLAWVGLAQADSIQLVNGDMLNGKVISLNEREVKLESEVLGEITVPRDKVSAIAFGDRPLTPKATAEPASTADAVQRYLEDHGVDPRQVEDLLGQLGGESADDAAAAKRSSRTARRTAPAASADDDATAEDVVRKLQTEGIDQQTVDELKGQMPLLNLPGVSGYFNKTLSGLTSGTLDLQHIRKDAVKARDDLKDLKKDLGPSGDALDGYLRILDKFIAEVEPPAGETEESTQPQQAAGESSGENER